MLLKQRLHGGLIGLLIGDAIGVPFEFSSPMELRLFSDEDFALPYALDASQRQRAHARAPRNAWSDDGAQALALLDSLQSQGKLDLNDFSRRLLNWEAFGDYAVGGAYFDIGNQTRAALKKLHAGIAPHLSGGDREDSNGNGSLMRVLPLVLWYMGDDNSLVQMAMKQSLPTHRHLRSQVVCALYALWARELLNGGDDGFDRATEKLKVIYRQEHHNEALWELDIILDDEQRRPTGSGYVVDSLWSARWAFLQGQTYSEVITQAIRLGNDTDTTACIAGGLAGIKYGIDGIPKLWRDELPDMPILTQLIDQMASGFKPAILQERAPISLKTRLRNLFRY